MKYSYIFSTPLIVVGLVGLLGCAPPAKELGSDRWVAGMHYEALPGPPPPRQRGGKIQVVEFFWYGCGHCYLLEPRLVLWSRYPANDVEFVQIPTQGRPASRAHARLFYTLKTLGRLDLHPLVFDAIHRGGNPLETGEQQRKFAGRYGIRGSDFSAASMSPAVEQALAEGDKAMRKYRLEGVPTMLIDGRYKTDLIRTGGERELIELIEVLTADK